jgi:quercetin dioxygenase-like cupin family protein
VTLFAFDAGQGLSEHSAPFDAFVHVLEGTAELTIGGEAVEASGGELVVMPRDVPHAVHAPTRFKMLLVMLKGQSEG